MRHMLETAAQHWGVAAAQYRGVQHAVVHAASGWRRDYGAIAPAAVLSVPSQAAVKLKDCSNWRLISILTLVKSASEGGKP
jgi:isoquinoline 1-oxidoreductase beta subunit